MTKKLKITWIDDDPKRESVAINLEKNINGKVNFKKVRGRKIEDVIDEIEQNPLPDLFVVDHRLDDVQPKTFRSGSTVAAALREKFPQHPVVGITAAIINIDLDLQQREAYEDIYSSTTISR